jgi:hypothetical protein
MKKMHQGSKYNITEGPTLIQVYCRQKVHNIAIKRVDSPTKSLKYLILVQKNRNSFTLGRNQDNEVGGKKKQ